MKLLHLDSSINGDASVSRAISAALVERLRAGTPSLEVTYRDLAAAPLPHLTLAEFGTLEAQEILAEFKAADIIVIGAGLYNFTVPTQLKSWIDRILIAGETFSYGESGPVGLVTGKRVIIGLARGAMYGEGSPVATWEHCETLLRLTFGFMGVTDLEFIAADGLAMGDELRKASTEAAIARAKQISLEPIAA